MAQCICSDPPYWALWALPDALILQTFSAVWSSTLPRRILSLTTHCKVSKIASGLDYNAGCCFAGPVRATASVLSLQSLGNLQVLLWAILRDAAKRQAALSAREL